MSSFSQKSNQPSPAELFSVSFNDLEITLTVPDGRAYTIPWSDLSSVALETTNEGPFMDDVFWILDTNIFTLRIPQDAKGEEELLGRLQQLPNFDNEAVVSAMGCAENSLFLCWQSDNEKPKLARA
jgi:hypothetical protein